MAEPLPCPMCGHAAGEVREVVADRVWSLECSSQRANHTASVMSWTSAEHCVETWNRYASPPVAVQEEGDAGPLMRMRGYHALVQVVYELQQDGQYSDEEGEETAALAELLAAIEKGGA